MNAVDITEKLLKDSFTRKGVNSEDITQIVVDLRKDTHDVLQVYVRGTVCGQLVTDKNDSVTIARRLLPESLKYGKEPSTIVKNMEQLGHAYGVLLMEVRAAISHGSVDTLKAYMRKLDADIANLDRMPGDGHLFVSDGLVRSQAASEEHR